MRLTIIAALALAACDAAPTGTPFERSCRGERYLDCDPHEVAVATSATLTPAGLSPLDGMTTAEVEFRADTCAMRPAPLRVQISALVAGPPSDAGPTTRVVDLVELRDDGSLGDDVADDGQIDAVIENPLGAGIPGDTTITLRFAPVVSGCVGEAIEVEYRTGPRVTM